MFPFYGSIICGDWQVGPPIRGCLDVHTYGVVKVAVDALQQHVSCLRQDIWGEQENITSIARKYIRYLKSLYVLLYTHTYIHMKEYILVTPNTYRPYVDICA